MNGTEIARRVESLEVSSPRETLEDAFAQYQSELLGTLFYLVGNREDARDALQETFVKCWRNQDKVRELRNVKAWIFRIALNTGRDLRQTAWRRKSKPLADMDMVIESNQADPARVAERADQLSRVREAVADLRPEEQEVFLLRQNGQLTYDEIAEAIGIPSGTVKTRMRLALSKLRLALV